MSPESRSRSSLARCAAHCRTRRSRCSPRSRTRSARPRSSWWRTRTTSSRSRRSSRGRPRFISRAGPARVTPSIAAHRASRSSRHGPRCPASATQCAWLASAAGRTPSARLLQGLQSVAAPIVGSDGEVLGAVAVVYVDPSYEEAPAGRHLFAPPQRSSRVSSDGSRPEDRSPSLAARRLRPLRFSCGWLLRCAGRETRGPPSRPPPGPRR